MCVRVYVCVYVRVCVRGYMCVQGYTGPDGGSCVKCEAGILLRKHLVLSSLQSSFRVAMCVSVLVCPHVGMCVYIYACARAQVASVQT